ncbi:hypothetical protein BH20VER1_BH20VER1_06150 [soil metagenome]
MPRKDPRIDAYIAKSAPFAQPILRHLRQVVHAGCPGVEETMKWSMPHFDYKGIMCGMAAHKEHCSFGFWGGATLALEGKGEDAEGMGQFGKIRSLTDLPPKQELLGYVRKAAQLNESGVKVAAPKREPKPEIPLPDYLTAALRRNKRAQSAWDKFSPSCRREYVEWITSAKREETREQRLETALDWIADGKKRHWQYEPASGGKLQRSS